MRDMKFDVIVGNPPYNGVDRQTVKRAQVYEPFLVSGYQSYYPFIAMQRYLLKPGGDMTYVVPCKWLTEMTAVSLRHELDKDGKFSYLDVEPQPEEWKIEIGQVSVFVFEKGRATHAPGIHSLPNGRFPNAGDPKTRKILDRVLQSHPTLPRVQCFRGAGVRLVEGAPIREYIGQYNKRCNGPVVKQSIEPKIAAAIRNGQQFLLYPDHQRAPFKVEGKNPKRVKVRVEAVEPMHVHDTFVVVPTASPAKMQKLLEHPVAKLVWRCFFDTRHFAPAMTDLLPDVTSLLPNNPTDEDINTAFGLTEEEVQHTVELAQTYGKDM